MPTTKDFQLVADMIRARLAEQDNDSPEWNVLADLAGDFAHRFAKENPRFRLSTFLTACGIGD